MKQALVCILTFLAGAAAGMFLPRSCSDNDDAGNVVTRTDTLIVRDTVIERHPVYVTSRVVDTVRIPLLDTVHVRVHDTLYVTVNREQKYYKGEDYEAWVSGYRPALDSVYVFPETRYVTETVQVKRKPTRWGIGIQAGYGVALPDGRPQLAPYLGVGISYNFIRF